VRGGPRYSKRPAGPCLAGGAAEGGEFASDLARERGFKVCLVISRRISVWYDARGVEYARTEATPEMPCEPFAVIGGKRVQFDLSGGEVLRAIDERGQ
jgi:hypothetical protein